MKNENEQKPAKQDTKAVQKTDEAPNRSHINEREETVLKFWKENNIFKKSVEKDAPHGNFVFYDGPPFATGLPHYGHLVPGTIKDVIPRYQTMLGKRVERRWGWDCHGFPIEQLVSKQLNLHTKKEIEEYGLEKFNALARGEVNRYFKEWKEIIPRVGRFVDMDDYYQTMDSSYTESVWWAFKTLSEKGLVYEAFKTMHVSPYYETTLSNFEVNQGYKDVVDLSVYALFKATKLSEKLEVALKKAGVDAGLPTFFMAWTTTPWTLPGNAALAVGPEISYALLKSEQKTDGGMVPIISIVASDLVEKVFGEEVHEVVGTLSGNDLVGSEYEPVFDTYVAKDFPNKQNAWKVYAGDFVETGDQKGGTGIVHIAPAFGEDDLVLAQAHNIPLLIHVMLNGEIKAEVKELAGRQAKPKDDPQSTDVEVIKYLAHRGNLFKKEKYSHSYPHDWRTDVPLLNYATSSWFVKVSDFKDKLISENNRVNWVPEEMGTNRFGKWLENARDWSVSRSRFWGTPLPIWKSEDGTVVDILGSLKDLKEKTRKNTYHVMRHGEGEHFIKRVLSSALVNPHDLTPKGVEDVKQSAEQLKNKGITKIVSSPILRCKKTAELVAGVLGIDVSSIEFDERLREISFGEWEGQSFDKYHDLFKQQIDRFTKAAPGGETSAQVKNRLGDFLYDFDSKHHEENVLLVTHEDCAWLLGCIADGLTNEGSIQRRNEMWKKNDPGNNSFSEASKNEDKLDIPVIHQAGICPIDFAYIPHNAEYELDFHRPYIDTVEYTDKKTGAKMKRIKDVFDTWFDSGSMPFASRHYPFERTAEFDVPNSALFPADFIAEGQDQTRGWFYVLLVLSVGLFGKAPYKNVISHGVVLAEDGRKMSKSLKNYPDMVPTVQKYGADALRLFLMASPVVRAEDVRFSEKGLDEVVKKVINRIDNMFQFIDLYIDDELKAISPQDPRETYGNNLAKLDQWMCMLLDGLNKTVTKALNAYEVENAARAFEPFLDELSTWYVRRSRERLKFDGADDQIKNSDRKMSYQTLTYVLYQFSLLSAPFIPFIAEHMYQTFKKRSPEFVSKESVHLENWPMVSATPVDTEQHESLSLLNKMKEVRSLVTLGLEARSKVGIKVRQPLKELLVRNDNFDLAEDEELMLLIKDEVNVKEIIFDAAFDEDDDRMVKLDTEITPELKREGQIRELVRAIQDARKKADLMPKDKAILLVAADEEGNAFIGNCEAELKQAALLSEIELQEDVVNGTVVSIDSMEFSVAVKK